MTKEGGAARQTEPNTNVIHDNPVSSNHQAPSHWKNSGNLDTYHIQYTVPRGMSRLGERERERELPRSEQQKPEWLDIWGQAISMQSPWTQAPATPAHQPWGNAAGQNCFEFKYLILCGLNYI